MDIDTMPHAMYFIGDSNTVTKINQVPYQTIEYNDNGMFTAKLMNDTPIKIFICTIPVPIIVLCLSAIFVHNINSSELHFQSVALRSQYSDHTPEAVTLH